MLLCGIDEAGRGPVIGPMVIAGVVIDEKDEHLLKQNGVKDSKMLTAAQRERLFKHITSVAIRYKIVVVPPDEIDRAVEAKEFNLNWLEAVKAVEMINELAPGRVVMDCPSPNIPAFTTYIRERLKWPDKVALECAHHADKNFPVVGAASILAKVTRDEHIERIKKEIGHDFRTGYAHDKDTVEFMKKYWDKYPHIFRHSWSSYQRYAGIGRTKGQKDLKGF